MDRQQVGKPQSFGQALFAPENRAENIKIALSVSVFAGAVVFLRQFGQLLAV
ncbi:hypothetical protein BC940DRAFT_311434 [Gongronella butleri]|nr:hypothetical protein BC940DRAFT_311434 [Gongronella butleri]